MAKNEKVSRTSTAKSVWDLKGFLPLEPSTISRAVIDSKSLATPPFESSVCDRSREICRAVFINSDAVNQNVVARHRDTPIYTEQGSPLLGQAYYPRITSDTTYPSGVVQLPQTIKDNQMPVGRDGEQNEGDQFSNVIDSSLGVIEPCLLPAEAVTSDLTNESETRESSLSIQCIGDSLFHNEAARLSSPLNLWNQRDSQCLPHILSQSMPGEQRRVASWINDQDSCSSDEDDALACATALAPSKAQVVEVAGSKNLGLSIQIPPRSSSLGTKRSDVLMARMNRESWASFGEYDTAQLPSVSFNSPARGPRSENHAEWSPSRAEGKPNVAMTSPPMSPAISNDGIFVSETLANPIITSELPHDGDSLHMMISALENHITCFPSNMLLSDSRCTAALRGYLHTHCDTRANLSHEQYSAPPSPALSDDSMFLFQDHEGTRSPTIPCFNQTSHVIRGLSLQALPNLEPLRRIFPQTSKFMRSALYAHVLAYFFVCTLSASNQTQTPTHTNPQSISRRPNSARCHRTSTISIPSKAATLLGMFQTSSHNNKEEIGYQFVSATAIIEDQLHKHISTLVSEMEGTYVSLKRGGRVRYISAILLRSLVEIVRAGEGF